MAFEDDVGIALAKACEQDNTKDSMHIAMHVLHKLYIIRYWLRPNLLMDSQRDAKRTDPRAYAVRGTQHKKSDGRDDITHSTGNCSDY